MFIKYVITNEILNSLQLKKKRVLADISSKNVKSDKRIKGNKSNVLNVDCKIIIKSPQSLENVQNR